MSEMGEKEIFIQFRATVRDRDRLKLVTKYSSAESASERIRMLITDAWKALPEDKR